MIPMASAGIVITIRRSTSPGKCSTVLLTAATPDQTCRPCLKTSGPPTKLPECQ